MIVLCSEHASVAPDSAIVLLDDCSTFITSITGKAVPLSVLLTDRPMFGTCVTGEAVPMKVLPAILSYIRNTLQASLTAWKVYWMTVPCSEHVSEYDAS